MRIQKTISFTIIVLLIPLISASMVSTNSSPLPSIELDFNNDPYSVELFTELDTASIQQPSLPTVEGFWTDLVNTERVSQTGEDVYVAILDTGLLPGWEFFFSEANIAADLGIGFTHDIYFDTTGNLVVGPLKEVGFVTELASGHGTHVTSTVVGYNVNNQYWVPGVAPDVTIIPVRVLDAWDINGLRLSGGFNDMIAAGINYIADLADELDGTVIINMSLGGPFPSAEIEAAIDNAISKGVIIVASAGNDGESGMGYPGAFDQVISAAAGGWTDMFTNWWNTGVPEVLNTPDSLGNLNQLYIEDFSSRPNPLLGQTDDLLDVAAPGAWIVGPYKSAFVENTGYYFLSGTSMAAPHVTGIAALIAQDNPDISQGAMEVLLKVAASGEQYNALRGFSFSGQNVKVAFPFISTGYYLQSWDENDFGTGFLDAEVAVFLAQHMDDDDDDDDELDELAEELMEELDEFYEHLFDDDDDENHND